MRGRRVVLGVVLAAAVAAVFSWSLRSRRAAPSAPACDAESGEFLLSRGPDPAASPAVPAPNPGLPPIPETRDVADGSVVAPSEIPLATVVSTEEEARTSGVRWVRRDVTLRGAVRGNSLTTALDFAAVRLSAFVADPGPEPGEAFLRAHGLTGPFPVSAPGADGTFEAVLPRVRGLAIAAAAPGFPETKQPVPVAADRDEENATIVLEAGTDLTGTVTGPSGAPVPGANVLVYVLFSAPAGDCGTAALRERYPGGGVAASRHRGESVWRVVLSHSGETGPDGRFSVRVRERGEIRFLVLARGFAPLERSVGPGEEVPADLALAVEAAANADATARVTFEGTPVRRLTIGITDQSKPDLKPGYTLDTDDEGRLRLEWLVVGRKYAFTPLAWPADAPSGAPLPGRLVVAWQGQGEIALPAPRHRQVSTAGEAAGR